MRGYYRRLVDDILNKFNRNKLRNGLYSVANFQVQTMTGCKLLCAALRTYSCPGQGGPRKASASRAVASGISSIGTWPAPG
jgi:hypothetical protein